VKLNEFKIKHKQRVDELALNQVIGDYGAAAAKQIGNRLLGRGEGNLSVKDKMAKDKFLQDFIGRASTALDSAVSSGLVDPNLGGAASPAAPEPKEPTLDPEVGKTPTPSPTPSPTPAPGGTDPEGSPPPAPSPAGTPAPTKPGMTSAQQASAQARGQRETNQNLNNYVQGAAKALNTATDKNQKIQLTKELVNYMADRKDYPEWGNAVATVQQVIKKGGTDPNFANAALAKLKSGQTMAESWQMYWINKLLEAVDLTWGDLGLTVLKESKGSTFKIVETKYYKLNKIFESMMYEAEAESIQSWFKRWLAQYMKGVDLSEPKTASQVDQYINAIQQSYKKDKGKAALNQLANAAFSLSYSNKGTPGAMGAAASTPAPAASTDSGGGPLARMAGNTSAATSTTPGETTPSSSPTTATTTANTATGNVGAPPTAQTGSANQNANQLITVAKNALQKLQKVDPAAYAAFVKELTGQKAPAGVPSEKPKTEFTPPPKPTTSPAPAPAGATVTTESRKYKPFKKW
jgi:hypothetical protein